MTRAFTHFLNFANIAEQYHVVRRRRQSEFEESTESPNPLVPLFEKFKQQEISAETLYQQICELKIELVLTAHPTEVSRRTLIQKYDGINNALSKFDQQKLTPRERQAVLADLNSSSVLPGKLMKSVNIAQPRWMKPNGALRQLNRPSGMLYLNSFVN